MVESTAQTTGRRNSICLANISPSGPVSFVYSLFTLLIESRGTGCRSHDALLRRTRQLRQILCYLIYIYGTRDLIDVLRFQHA